MTRWVSDLPRPPDPHGVTDDPLAALGLRNKGRETVYAVSRVNPIYHPPRQKTPEIDYDETANFDSCKKSASSGYGGSILSDKLRLVEEAGIILEQNPAFVKSIRIAGRGLKGVPSHSSSAAGTLTTIPEGRVELPQPIWPGINYDSIVDEALLLYTSLSNHNVEHEKLSVDVSVKDFLLELLANINDTLEGKSCTPEEMLKLVNERIKLKLEVLKHSTEDEMRKLSVNLSNNRKVNSVIRALSHSSSSSTRLRTTSNDDLYHIASGSSSSGFSDSPPGQRRGTTPLLYGRKLSQIYCDHHQDTSLSRGIRNALIYGTLSQKMRTVPSISHSLKCKINCDKSGVPKDDRPSVWQMYYGVKAEGHKRYGEGNPKDVPVFPNGRPEADFTLDVPRSELLSKRMREDKKWRFRCRVLTSFLGLVFFLLSVMAVSLVLTRGKRMFGSMV